MFWRAPTRLTFAFACASLVLFASFGTPEATAQRPAAAADTASAESQSPPSNAHDEEARALYEAGKVAFEDGRFADALGYFERSYELSRRPALLYNIGTAADRIRQNERALEAFEAYLEAVPDAPDRRSVEARIEVLHQSPTVPSAAETARAGQSEQPPTIASSAPEKSRRGLWIGLGAAAVAVVTVAVVLGIALGTRDPEYQPSSEGILYFTLQDGP